MDITLVLEITGTLLFILFLYHASRRGNQVFLISSFLFSVLFENANIFFSKDMFGGYTYSDSFILFIGETPLVICLLWSVIIYSSYFILKGYAKKRRFIYFFAPLYALNIDIILDIIATRLSLWSWNGYDFNTGFYGIPAENYLGWLFVVFCFLVTYEFLKVKETFKLVLVPMISYMIFMSIFGMLSFIIHLFSDRILYAYIVFILIWSLFFWYSLMNLERKEHVSIDLILFVPRILMYIFIFTYCTFLSLFHYPLISFILFAIIIVEISVFYAVISS